MLPKLLLPLLFSLPIALSAPLTRFEYGTCSLDNWTCVDKSHMCLGGHAMPCSGGTMCVKDSPCTVHDDGSSGSAPAAPVEGSHQVDNDDDDDEWEWACDDDDDDTPATDSSSPPAAPSAADSSTIRLIDTPASTTSAVPPAISAVPGSNTASQNPAGEDSENEHHVDNNPSTAAGNELMSSAASSPKSSTSTTDKPTSTIAEAPKASATPVATTPASGGGAQFEGEMTGGYMTVFDDGITACGEVPADVKFYVAIKQEYFESYPGCGPGSKQSECGMCGKKIAIDYHGTRTEAAVYDKCVGCPDNNRLDLIRPLWQEVFKSLPQKCVDGTAIGPGRPDAECNVGAPPTWSWL